jgi:hypothetical protein
VLSFNLCPVQHLEMLMTRRSNLSQNLLALTKVEKEAKEEARAAKEAREVRVAKVAKAAKAAREQEKERSLYLRS